MQQSIYAEKYNIKYFELIIILTYIRRSLYKSI